MFKNLIGALGAEQIILIVLLAVMVVVLIVLPMFTNRRRNKAVNELYNSIVPGDVIKTVGGVIGEVKEVRQLTPVDKQIVIETGADGSKTTMVFDIQAVYQVLNKVNAPAPAPVPNEAAGRRRGGRCGRRKRARHDSHRNGRHRRRCGRVREREKIIRPVITANTSA